MQILVSQLTLAVLPVLSMAEDLGLCLLAEGDVAHTLPRVISCLQNYLRDFQMGQETPVYIVLLQRICVLWGPGDTIRISSV